MVATIAPGPASSGVPSGTSATFVVGTLSGSSDFPVSNCNATSTSSSPPAPCNAGRSIPRARRPRFSGHVGAGDLDEPGHEGPHLPRQGADLGARLRRLALVSGLQAGEPGTGQLDDQGVRPDPAPDRRAGMREHRFPAGPQN